MKFLTFIRHPESFRDHQPPAALMEAMGKFIQKSLAEGILVDTGGLMPSSQAKRIRLSNRKLTITDGPFTEAKEVIGGYAILELPTMADAMRVSMEFMKLHLEYWPDFEGESEVRPMFAPDEGP